MSACNMGDLGSVSGSGRSPGEGNWQPTPVFLLGESHGRRSLVGYSPRGRKESDTTERLHFHFYFRQHIKKQRHYFANIGPSSQSYDFSSSHVQM